MEEQKIRVKCFEDDGKLTYRIITPGYCSDAIILLAQNLRKLHREFLVSPRDLRMKNIDGRYVFRVSPSKIDWTGAFDSPTDNDLPMPCDDKKLTCWLCKQKKNELLIYIPCGHRFSCESCSEKSVRCEVCHYTIDEKITNSHLITTIKRAGGSFK
jgi:hypothetical protein